MGVVDLRHARHAEERAVADLTVVEGEPVAVWACRVFQGRPEDRMSVGNVVTGVVEQYADIALVRRFHQATERSVAT